MNSLGQTKGSEIEVAVRTRMNHEFETCEDYSSQAGYRCVSFFSCSDGDIISNGGGYVQPKSLTFSKTKCYKNDDVCCQKPDFVPPSAIEVSTSIEMSVTVNVTANYKSENCIDYEDQGYECVPVLRCLNGTIISNNNTLQIAPRGGWLVLNNPSASKCPTHLQVCCYNPNPKPAPTPPPKTGYTPQCGQRHTRGLGIQLKGLSNREAQIGEWPHMCAIMKAPLVLQPRAQFRTIIGGASLIAPGIVVTAAHKVARYSQDPSALMVRCGDWDLEGTDEPQEHQERTVSHIDLHPAFDKDKKNDTIEAYYNNWALLYMESEFELAEHIDTVCLPQPGDIFDNKMCYATGWGKDHDKGDYQTILKEVQKPVVSDSQCLATLRNAGASWLNEIDDSVLCAGGAGEDTCVGDGGGPLVCRSSEDEPDRYVLAGMVSTGIECNIQHLPAFYVDVAVGVCWIDWAVTCMERPSGGYNSYFGFGSECQEWMDDERKRLRGKSDGRSRRMLETFQSCTVNWGNDEYSGK